VAFVLARALKGKTARQQLQYLKVQFFGFYLTSPGACPSNVECIPYTMCLVLKATPEWFINKTGTLLLE